MTEQMYHVYQLINGENVLLYSVPDQKQAENEVERINGNLQHRGIPSWVSYAFVE